jgi:GNAT superfamily N-acetyltransferase
MAIVVRKATRDDGEAIAKFAIELFEQHRSYNAERFAKIGSLAGAARFYGSRNDTGDGFVLIAELNGKAAGFAYLEYEKINYPALLENAVWLHDIYVEPSARKAGIGKDLMEAVIDAAKDFGATKIMLSVAAKNTVAQEFFEQRGFRTTMLEMMLTID